MSKTPDGTTPNEEQATKQPEPSIEAQVNEVVSKMVKDTETGKWTYPEGTPEAIQFAAQTEKRRRDTQAALSKTASQAKAADAENQALRQRLAKEVKAKLTPEQQTQLDELKEENPDEWRIRMNNLEADALKALNSELDETRQESTKAGEIAAREVILSDFLARRPGLVINQEVIDNEIPPRITKKLADGEFTFEEFLTKVEEYLTTDKVIKNVKTSDQPNLNDVGGSATIDLNAVKKDMQTSYEDEIF